MSKNCEEQNKIIQNKDKIIKIQALFSDILVFRKPPPQLWEYLLIVTVSIIFMNYIAKYSVVAGFVVTILTMMQEKKLKFNAVRKSVKLNLLRGC